MYFTASVHAYDVMSMVRVSWTVTDWEAGPDGRPTSTTLVSGHTDVQGSGESSPREWLKDALVACLESL